MFSFVRFLCFDDEISFYFLVKRFFGGDKMDEKNEVVEFCRSQEKFEEDKMRGGELFCGGSLEKSSHKPLLLLLRDVITGKRG